LKKEVSGCHRNKKVNGVNVEQLFNTINLIKEKTEIARFRFRATNQWVDGTHNRATVRDFYGALQEDTSREPMVFEKDEPPVLCRRTQYFCSFSNYRPAHERVKQEKAAIGKYPII